MALPARGAQALGLKADQARFNKKYPQKPKVPRVPKVKPPSMDEVANRNAMTTFRAALAQLQASQAPVDSAAIYAPYRASQQVVGQLGQGLQTAVQGAGQAAQTQYAQGRDVAQQHAAQFGISAGAGANPTALQDTGTGALATQTNAYAAAAPQAATAWQQLLERSAAAKVSEAQLARTNVLNQGQASLATNLPSLIGDEKTKLFQQHVQKFNEGVTRTQLDAKQKNDLRDYLIGKGKLQLDAQTAATKTQQTQQQINQKTANDAAKIKISKATLALKQRSQTASASGLKGIAGAVKALSGTTSGGSTKKVAKGWMVTYQPVDPDTGLESGNVTTVHMPSKEAPSGGKFISAQTNYQTVPNTPSTSGITRKQWDTQMRALVAQNPGRAAEVKKFLGPRPKK